MDSQQLKQARLDKKLLSNVSKMPGYSISRERVAMQRRRQACRDRAAHARIATPARECITCRTSARKMIEREEFFNAPDFVPRMVNVLNIVRSEWFRWFDSGDVADVGMALNILEVCRQTPNKRHWIPSREFKVWTRALQIDRLPENAVLRMSPTWWTDHGPRHGRPHRPCTQESKPCPAESARRPSRRKMRRVPRLLVR